MINAVVVGYGGMGKVHCDFVRSVSGLNLYAVCDTDKVRRQTAEKDFAVRTFESMDQVLEDDAVTLIIIATPHNSHAPLSIKAMDAGKNVVVEKVMCLSVAEADAMIAASKKNNVMLSVFQSRRWDSDYVTVKQIVESGILGEVFLVESSYSWYGQPGGWRREKKYGGGHIYDWGAHLIDQAVNMIKSEAETVFCDFQYRIWKTDVESYFKCLIRFKSRLIYEIDIGNILHVSKPRWYALGELGALIKRYIGVDEKVRVKTHGNGVISDMEIECVRAEWRDYYVNISHVLNEGAELLVKPEDVRKGIVIIEAAIKSAEIGESVKLVDYI